MTRYLRNRMLPMLVSVIIILVSSLPLYMLNSEPSIRWLVYPLAAIQGVGIAIMLNTATSLISDVIGNDSENSAFIYGCYSLFDKCSNGALLYYVIREYSEDAYALKVVMSLVPLIAAALALVLVYIGQTFFSHKMAKISG